MIKKEQLAMEFVKTHAYQMHYSDLVWYSDMAAHPFKFVTAQHQCERIMKSKKKLNDTQIAEFNSKYRILWMPDNTIEINAL